MHIILVVLGESAIDIVLINAVAPLLYAYGMSVGNEAVSYTHLDVYKRQALACTRRSPGATFSVTQMFPPITAPFPMVILPNMVALPVLLMTFTSLSSTVT